MVAVCRAGVLPHLFWDYTYRELAAVLEACGQENVRQHQLHLWAGWKAAWIGRHKKLPSLKKLLRELEPSRLMSPKAVRQAVLDIAKAMGAKVTHRKKGDR